MPDLIQAVDVVRKAASELRDLMLQALEQQRFRDLAQIAPLAEGLANLIRRAEAHEPLPIVAPRAATSISIPTSRGAANRSASRNAARDEYPRFERDGDKLVKVAWSKKDRREYEHRAPRDAVLRVAGHLASEIKPGEVFSMDRLMPFKNTDGNDMPSYQAYLALAWFRDLGSVQQRGKVGYSVVDGLLSTARVEEAWSKLQARK